MRSWLVFVPALLGSCAAAQPPVHGETPGHTCRAAGSARFIGQPGTSETGSAIVHATNAAVLRWAPPGVMLTMDFRADRVTVRIDSDRRVTAINCG